MTVLNLEEKKKFYESILKNKIETYIKVKTKNEEPKYLYVCRSNLNGLFFVETNCELIGYTFTKGNKEQEKFMKEQGFFINGDKAYDIQISFEIIPPDKYMGEMIELPKRTCIQELLSR